MGAGKILVCFRNDLVKIIRVVGSNHIRLKIVKLLVRLRREGKGRKGITGDPTISSCAIIRKQATMR